MGGRGAGGGASGTDRAVLSAIRNAEGARVFGGPPTASGFKSVVDVRESLGLPAREVDNALRKLATAGRITLAPNEHPRSMTAKERANPIRFGDRDNHWVKIQ